MGSRDAKNELFDALASVAKVLGNGRRAEIVDVLAQGERSVEELSSEIGQTVANTSQHLQHLLRAGLVDTRRDGTRIYYSLSSPSVSHLWGTIRQVAEEHIEHLEELATSYLGDRSTLTTMTRSELTDRLDAGDVMVIDVRPEVEFRAGHIAGATSIPVKELEERLDGLPDSRLVVAYCRGPYCVYADDAVRALGQRGIQAARLEEGYPEWQDAGLPVQTN
ncbi:metalloregulator ArsR/SmtB family transcription factor [Arthrobacter sp. ISL-30]|uniref:ArsR/SmtB family transcription factor n=1 Tax=Arthrobacter sp. ISL-30 TaxID=2819109 RepID=UPI001BE7ABFA|nr:metalloregulator ArsR/SmtB family transcription factor [Arthrobacter sp. ISL-30]MBT2512621.1 metalloregulator ArsR/SmtB family transcription factor [Arthrobacter sp. ISL-30]